MLADCFNPKPQPPNCLIKPLETNLKDRKLILQILNNIDNNNYHIQTSKGIINNEYLCELESDSTIKSDTYNIKIIGDLNQIYNILKLDIDLILLHEKQSLLNNIIFISQIFQSYNGITSTTKNLIELSSITDEQYKLTDIYLLSQNINQSFSSLQKLIPEIIVQLQNQPDFINDPYLDNSIIQKLKLALKLINDIIKKSANLQLLSFSP